MKKVLLPALFLISFYSIAQKPVLVVPRGHSENANQISISSDNRFVASGGWDKSVHIWQLATGNELKVLDGYPAWIYSVAFSPDNKLLASGSRKELRINDMSAGAKEIFRESISTNDILDLAFSPDSRLLVTAAETDKRVGDGGNIYELKIWETTSMKILKRIEIVGGFNHVKLVFTSNNEMLATGFRTIYHINPISGSITSSEKFSEYHEDGCIVCSDFYKSYLSPDGSKLVGIESRNETVSGTTTNYGIIEVIDPDTKSQLHVFKLKNASIKDAGLSPDNRYITIAADESIFIYDLKEMKLAGKLTNTMSYPHGLKFTSDSKTFISGNYDGIVRVYDFEHQTLKRELGGHANIIHNMDLSADGKSLAVMGNQGYYKGGYIQLLDLDRGAIDKSNYAKSMNFAGSFTPDKKYFISGSFEDALTVMNSTNLQKLSTLKIDDIATSFAVSNDGKQMISTDYSKDDHKLLLRSLPSGKVLKTIKLPLAANCFLYSPDGRFVFAGMLEDDKTIKVDLQSGTITKTFRHQGEYNNVTGIKKILLSNDGSTLITGDDYGHIRFWDIATGKEIGDIKDAGGGRLNSMILLPGGKQLATCGGESAFTNTTINIIDIATRQVVKTLEGHNNSPTTLAVTPDAKFLLSGSYDRTIKVWNLETGKSLASMVFFGGSDWVIVDNNGRFDGTKDGMQQLYYTRGLDVLPLESSFEKFYTPNLLPRLLQGEKFTPSDVDINTIKAAPVVKITYKGEIRNLEVADDMPAYVSATGKVSIIIDASSKDDMISEIRLYQNGKLINGGTRNLEVADDGKPNEKKEFQVDLSEGQNIIKAIALNSQRTESSPDLIAVTFKPEKKENNAKPVITLHLLVVGVNTYKNPRYTLNYALADATSFKGAIEKGSTGIFSNLNVTFLTDADASKEKITGTLEKIKQEAAPQDMLVFYYAGHGVINDTKEFFLVPYDVLQLYGNDNALAQKGISAALLQQYSKEIKAQKQLFILDACQSAGALNEVAGARGAAEEKAIAQLARSTGTHWLTASGSEQFASEFGQLGHGSFTYCILQALQGGADNGDHKITVNELDAYLQDKVPEITQKYKGTAQYPASYNYGNDFPIITIHN